MPLGWETNTKYTVGSESLMGKSELGMGNPRAPQPLYYLTLNTHINKYFWPFG